MGLTLNKKLFKPKCQNVKDVTPNQNEIKVIHNISEPFFSTQVTRKLKFLD